MISEDFFYSLYLPLRLMAAMYDNLDFELWNWFECILSFIVDVDLLKNG